jgi:hypothetical protein
MLGLLATVIRRQPLLEELVISSNEARSVIRWTGNSSGSSSTFS